MQEQASTEFTKVDERAIIRRLYIIAGLNAKAERHLSEAIKWFPDDAETLTLLHRSRSGETGRPTSGSYGRKG